MSGPWVCERSDGLAVYVYDSTDMRPDQTRPVGHATELHAWAYALDVQLENRAELSRSITECRANIRRLKRQRAQPKDTPNAG